MRKLLGFCALPFFVMSIVSCSHKSTENRDWFKVQFKSLCKGHEGFYDSAKLAKFGARPYDTVRTVKGDSLIVSFDFIDDCCLTFSGVAQANQDTVILKYAWDKWYTEACACWCEYRLTYRIFRGGRNWRIVKILHDEKSIFKTEGNK